MDKNENHKSKKALSKILLSDKDINLNFKNLKLLHSMDQKEFLKELNFENVPKQKKSWKQKLMENFKPGVTLGIITVPLSISMGVSCGASPSSSIMSTILCGLIMSFYSGSQYTMLGPTPAISAILQHCCLEIGMVSLPFISIISGILCYMISFYNLEKYIDLFPLSIIEGFTLGTALAMILGQVNNILGIKANKGHIHSNIRFSPDRENSYSSTSSINQSPIGLEHNSDEISNLKNNKTYDEIKSICNYYKICSLYKSGLN